MRERNNEIPALPKAAIAILMRAREVLRARLAGLENTINLFYQNGNGAAANAAHSTITAAIALDEARRARLAAREEAETVQTIQKKKKGFDKAAIAARRRRTATYLKQFSTTTSRAAKSTGGLDNRTIGVLIASGYLKRGKTPGTYLRTAKVFTESKATGKPAVRSSVWFARRDGTIKEAKPARPSPARKPDGETAKREARRTRSAALLGEFDETTARKLPPGYPDAKFLGPLVRRGYLKKAAGDTGYLRTGKVFSVSLAESRRQSA